MARFKADNIKKQYVLTYEKLVELEKELLELKVKRKEISKEINEIRDSTDGLKGSLYYAAKDRQRDNEARISEIEYIFKNAIVHDKPEVLDCVAKGCKVKVHDLEYDEYIEYSIVSSSEANSLKNKISDESPLGKALIGRKEGELVKISTGTGRLSFKILEIIEPVISKQNNKTSLDLETAIVKNTTGDIKTVDISPKDFLTRISVVRCRKHKIIDIMCNVKILSLTGSLEIHTVPGHYCETCDKYYMLENIYRQLKTKGHIVCKVVEMDFWSSKSNYMNLNQESVLHIMGYNVNVQTNLTKEQRRKIMELIVDEEILSIAEICSHLQWLINRNKNNKNFDDARVKWEEDCRYIESYKSKKRNVVEVKSITAKKIIYKK